VTVTLEVGLDTVKANHCATYLCQMMSFSVTVIRPDTQTDTHTSDVGPISLPGLLKLSYLCVAVGRWRWLLIKVGWVVIVITHADGNRVGMVFTVVCLFCRMISQKPMQL